MFDPSSYSKEFLESHEELVEIRDKYFEELSKVEPDDIKTLNKIDNKYKEPIIKAEKRFAKEHDKYCDEINVPQMKITEKWSKFW